MWTELRKTMPALFANRGITRLKRRDVDPAHRRETSCAQQSQRRQNPGRLLSHAPAQGRRAAARANNARARSSIGAKRWS